MKKKVLIIEDNTDILENIKEMLELSNYNVHIADNGLKGLELVQQVHPDIILCDIMMPELDGYGVLRGLGNNPKTRGVPFIFMTAKSEKQDIRKGMDLGADDYLTKPFSGDDLLSLIGSRLKRIDELKDSRPESAASLEKFLSDPLVLGDIYALGDQVSSKKIRKKDVLFTEGDSAKNLYFIVSGMMKTFRINEQGKEYITKIYRPNEFFGYSLSGEINRYEETAVAIEDSEIACINLRDFHSLLASNQELYLKFIRDVSSDLSESKNKLIGLAYDSARKRVAEAVLYLAKKYVDEPADDTSFPASRDDLSAISGVSPESVSRNLTDLRIEKLIELQSGKIKILNIKKLVDLKN